MGSKKHKKESKKKKHRSRSRSPLEGEERERKRHRKHKDRKKDRSPDVEEVPVDSHLVEGNGARSRSGSDERDARLRDRDLPLRDRDPPSRDRDPPPRDRDPPPRDRDPPAKKHGEERSEPAGAAGTAAGGGGQQSLSVEETNRLRAQLGLKPLELNEQPADDGKLKDDLGEFYHKPAANISEEKKSQKIREKLDERREKRKLEKKLQQTRALGEDSGDEDATAWVRRSRDLAKQKEEAAKRAAVLDELDEEFGVGALLAEEARAHRPRYADKQLRGLRVGHDIDELAEERETILTLADREVLADAEDVLVNVNLLDDTRYKKNQAELKKARAGYQAYDDEEALEALARGGRAAVLAKYDTDDADKEGFRIGDDSVLDVKKFRDLLRQEAISGGGPRVAESLSRAAPQLASEYVDPNDLTFKKPKKKGKMRKKAKAEPIDVEAYDAAAAPLDTDDTEPAVAAAGDEEDEVEIDGELQVALARARRLALQTPHSVPKVEEILEQVKDEPMKEEADEEAMVFDATAEFCRTLGDIPTYGLAGNRDHHAEIMDFENELAEPELEPEAGGSGAWSRVDVNCDKPADITAGVSAGLCAEPVLGAGVAGALQLALSKGYLERAGDAPAPRTTTSALHARHYSIEDKAQGEDDKYGRRERGHGHGHGGPLQDFREKPGFRPAVKLEYVDDDGRALCPKEAFRYLSHKFHGKGPGKNKQEKRIKKAVQEGLMKKMSSTDTPLGTLQMLQDKQRETHSPYVVLSGAKREPHH